MSALGGSPVHRRRELRGGDPGLLQLAGVPVALLGLWICRDLGAADSTSAQASSHRISTSSRCRGAPPSTQRRPPRPAPFSPEAAAEPHVV
jgi:hypothetical protein